MGMMKYDWKVQNIPFAGYAVASRRVPVLQQHSQEVKLEEPVYENPEQWELHLSPGIEVNEIHPFSKKRALAQHKHELKKIGSTNSISSMDSSYLHGAGSSGSVCSTDSPPASPTMSPKGSISPLSRRRTSSIEEEPWLDGFTNEQAVRYMKVLSGFGLNSRVSERLVKLAGFSRHLVDTSPLSSPVGSPCASPSKPYTAMLPSGSSPIREVHALTRFVTL
jgi:hypothetical protein